MQMGYLKDWAFLGRDHIRCLAGAVEGLKATTLHLPVTDGARVSLFREVLWTGIRKEKS